MSLTRAALLLALIAEAALPIALPRRLEQVESFIIEARRPGVPLRVADVCCDHGALAIALCRADAAHYVLGVDIAERALAGAVANARLALGERDACNLFARGPSRLELRRGDGLGALRQLRVHEESAGCDEPAEGGEADVLAVSGVGVRTTFDILRHDDEGGECGRALRRRGVRALVLQPGANPRPTALRALRAFVLAAGFELVADSCELIGGRHYITLACARPDATRGAPPGHGAAARERALLGLARAWPADVADGYARHHAEWLRKDLRHMAEWSGRRWGSRVGCAAADEPRHGRQLDAAAGSTSFVELVAASDLDVLDAFLAERRPPACSRT